MPRSVLLLVVLLGFAGACGQEPAEDRPADADRDDGPLPVANPSPDDLDDQDPGQNPGDQNPGDQSPDPGQDPGDQNPGDQNPGDQNPTPGQDPGDQNPPGQNGQGQCQVWQDCGPLYDDPNSGFECVQNSCQCDPAGQWSGTCTSMGGFWVASACQCVFSDVPPPSDDPNPNCWWDLYQPTCDADRWIDTSHYEDECGYNSAGDWECNSVWVESGYYEDGACPPPYWIEKC